MKKRLKELLALCMAGIMVFAMTTGFAAADDTPANIAPTKAEYTEFESVNNYPDKVFYPGDIIASDKISGINFYVVKPVSTKYVPEGEEKSKDYAGIPAEDWTHFKNTYSKDPSDYDKVYRCWQGINWEDYAVLLAWYSKESTQYWFEVDTEKLSKKTRESIASQAKNFYEYSTYVDHYYGTGIASKDRETNTNASFSFYCMNANGLKPLYEGDVSLKTTNLRYALRLPTADKLFGTAYSEYGYHYKLRALEKASWPNYHDGLPTGIVQVRAYEGDAISGCLADTIFSCNQNDMYVDPEGTESEGSTNSQISLMLAFEDSGGNEYVKGNEYTVNFVGGEGATGAMDPYHKAEYAKSDKLPANKFTKTGYSFAGWKIKDKPSYIESGTSGAPITIEIKGETGNIKAPYQDLYNDKAHYTPSRNNETVTLEAQWTPNKYTVKFDTDGGSDITDKTVKWADKVLADVEDPTKDGFTFKGWKYGETDVTADTTYSDLAENDKVSELKLTAQWEKVVVPADEPDDTSSTGDNMNITLLMALLLLSGCGIAGAGLYRRNRVK